MKSAWRRLGAPLVAATLGTGHAQTADDYLQQRWYRLEVIVFAPRAASDAGEARPRLLETLSVPRQIAPMAALDSPSTNRLPFGPPLPVDDAVPLIIANIPPPVWFAGDCVAEFWQPKVDLDASSRIPPDPCLAAPEPSAHDAAPAAVEPEPLQDPSAPPVAAAPDPRESALEQLAEAFGEYEQGLLATSYAWRNENVALRSELRRLRPRYDIIAAGRWHQPLPPRDQPLALLVQAGALDAERRFPLEGWFSVTVGRLIHFEARLRLLLANGGVALLDERRPMRSKTRHYLDHPAMGLLVWAEPVTVPAELMQQLASPRQRYP